MKKLTALIAIPLLILGMGSALAGQNAPSATINCRGDVDSINSAYDLQKGWPPGSRFYQQFHDVWVQAWDSKNECKDAMNDDGSPRNAAQVAADTAYFNGHIEPGANPY